MDNRTQALLTVEQRALLKTLVDAYKSGRKSEFIVVQTHGSSPSLIYLDGSEPNIAVNADQADFQCLAKCDFITLGVNGAGDLRGKPTARGIAFLEQAESDVPREPTLVDNYRELSAIAEFTESLRREIAEASQTYADAKSIQLPFHSAYRADARQQPSPEQLIAIAWREKLSTRNNRLRTLLILEGRGALIELFPLLGFGRDFNFGYSISAPQCSELLAKELDVLRQEMERVRNRPRAVFPNIRPDTMKVEHFWNVVEPDLRSDESMYGLLLKMFHAPEVIHYYFHQSATPLSPLLTAARDRGDISLDEYDTRYYLHPATNSERDFTHIGEPEGEYRWDWMRQVVEKGPEYIRYHPRLTERKRRELDVWARIELEEMFRKQRDKRTFGTDVFLSFSSHERAEAEILRDWIHKAGGKAFLAPKDLQPGDNFANQIREALINSEELWVLLSPQSLKSPWVMTEWGAAWALQKRIVPILFRCSPADLPERLASLQCIDLHACEEFVMQRFAKDRRSSETGAKTEPE